MDIFLSHDSALELWRRARNSGKPISKRARSALPSIKPVDAQDIQTARQWGFTEPLHIMVRSANARKVSRQIKSHCYAGHYPKGCFVQAREGLLVSTPEFCFLQMASQLTLIELIQLGYELCGSYSLPVERESDQSQVPGSQDREVRQTDQQLSLTQSPPTNQQPIIAQLSPINQPLGFTQCQPATTVTKLRAFVASIPAYHGCRNARAALRHIIDGSASPMETKLTMLLTLPQRLGGYGFAKPVLNQRIELSSDTKRATTKHYYACDLYWPTTKTAIEYDSDQFHTGTERIASDSKRRNALSFAGITPLTVTRAQVYEAREMERVALVLGRQLQRPLRKTEINTKKQRELRRVLLGH